MTKPPASLDEIVAAHAIDIELAVKRARLAYEIATTSLFRDVSHSPDVLAQPVQSRTLSASSST